MPDVEFLVGDAEDSSADSLGSSGTLTTARGRRVPRRVTAVTGWVFVTACRMPHRVTETTPIASASIVDGRRVRVGVGDGWAWQHRDLVNAMKARYRPVAASCRSFLTPRRSRPDWSPTPGNSSCAHHPDTACSPKSSPGYATSPRPPDHHAAPRPDPNPWTTPPEPATRALAAPETEHTPHEDQQLNRRSTLGLLVESGLTSRHRCSSNQSEMSVRRSMRPGGGPARRKLCGPPSKMASSVSTSASLRAE